MATNKKMA